MTVFVYAARVYPEVLNAILPNLLPTKLILLVCSLVLTLASLYVSKGYLVIVSTPFVRKNSVYQNAISKVCSQREFISTVPSQETHDFNIAMAFQEYVVYINQGTLARLPNHGVLGRR